MPDPSVVVVGADLADPANDPLPTEPTDPAVADEDGDGNPGVTMVAVVPAMICQDEVEELYICLRTAATLSGTSLPIAI